MSNAAAFLSRWAPYAEEVHAATGVCTGLLLALACEETGYGTSALAAKDNVWSVRFTSQAPPGTTDQPGGFCGYPSQQAAAEDMIRVLRLPYYAAVRQAQGVQAQVAALVDSPYNGASLADRRRWGQTLLAVYQEQGLAAYDAPGAPAPAAAPAVASVPGASVQTGAGSVTVTGLGAAEGPALLALALAALLATLLA